MKVEPISSTENFATFKFSEVSYSSICEFAKSKMSLSNFNQPDDFGFVIPKSIKEKLKTKYVENKLVDSVSVKYESIFKSIIDKAKKLYDEMISIGISKNDAEYILPNACYVDFFVSGNFHEWYQFLESNLSSNEHREIKELAYLVLNNLYEISPITFQDLLSTNLKTNNRE